MISIALPRAGFFIALESSPGCGSPGLSRYEVKGLLPSCEQFGS
ncbi:hypothetical protein SynROS8604_01925 [Synechococcus sp. ROS8604]|nr:hypothetical protein SynROS8604_01925 [Synechococcus sp. ROS8604]